MQRLETKGAFLGDTTEGLSGRRVNRLGRDVNWRWPLQCRYVYIYI